MRCKDNMILTGLICLMLLTSIATIVKAQSPNFPSGARIVGDSFSEDEDKFSFAIIGDKTGGGQDKWPIFDRAMEEINELKPHFAIMVGDLIQGYTENNDILDRQWKEFWEHQSRLEVPFLPLPGNHDISNRVMYDYWVNQIGLTYYAFIHNNCLFLLLNTEEGKGSEKGWFGKTQIAYAIGELEKNRDVRHTFVLMHKPAWLSTSDWNQIEAALVDREYTVFAGHYHKLTLHTRNDRRYFVLGGTGAGFTRHETKEYGAFDHYSIVTVDGDDVTVALIEPGNIYPANIATAEFKAKFGNLISYQTDWNIDRSQPTSSGKITFNLKNELEKQAKVEIVFEPAGDWQISPAKLDLEIQPGWETKGLVDLDCLSNSLTPLPTFRYAIIYGGELLRSRSVTLTPFKSADLHYLKDWMIVGPFDLGTTQRPAQPAEHLTNFDTKLGPELDDQMGKKYEGKNGEVSWQEYHAQGQTVDLNQAFGASDWAIGYGVTYILSPDERTVFGGIRGDDVTRLVVNGLEIYTQWSAQNRLKYVDLHLKKGWNTIMIKSADYSGGWNYRLAVENPKSDLVFANTKAPGVSD